MAELQVASTMVFSSIAWLVPIGLALLTIGAAREEQAERVAATSLIALASAVCGYLLTGFAFQFGGVAWVSTLPGLQGLTAEWSPLDASWGPGWGVVGLSGFLLQNKAYESDAFLLFSSQLPAVTSAVLVTLLALCRHVRRILLVPIGLLVSGLVYPLVGNWVWGGGWLANLGRNIELGHGFIDPGGAASTFLLGTGVALGAFLILKPERPADAGTATLPPIHFPLLVVLGALLSVAGWPGLVLGNPLLAGKVSQPLVVTNLTLAASGGALAVSLYTWFATNQPNALAAARGAAAGLVGASAACAFVPAGAALLIGVAAGLLMIVTLFFSEQVLKLQDSSASTAIFGAPAVWGILALSVFADGRWGAGWNGVGLQEYAGVVGQGVSGLMLAKEYQPAGPGQLQAQLTGLVATIITSVVLPWVIFKAAVWVQAAGQPVAAKSSPADTAETVSPPSEVEGEKPRRRRARSRTSATESEPSPSHSEGEENPVPSSPRKRPQRRA